MQGTASLVAARGGTRVDVSLDLQLSGPAAQYGRGMISDVTEILMRDFATQMQARIDAAERGLSPDQVGAAGRRAASPSGCGRYAWRWAACCDASSCPTSPARVEEDH